MVEVKVDVIAEAQFRKWATKNGAYPGGMFAEIVNDIYGDDARIVDFVGNSHIIQFKDEKDSTEFIMKYL